MDEEARYLLDDMIAFCQRDGMEARLINMLEQCQPEAVDDSSFTLQAPSRFAISYLEKQRLVLESYIEEITFAPLQLKLTVPAGRPARMAAAPVAAAPGVAADARTGAVPSAAPATDSATVMGSAPLAAAVPAAGMSPAAAPTAVAANPAVAPATPAQAQAEAAAAAASTPATTPIGAPAQEAPEGRAINVKNTVSKDDFRRLMAEMRGEAQPAPTLRPVTPTAVDLEPQGPASNKDEFPPTDVNSKFTFENFVFGDENKHAYQSALRFAAFADEPGQCTSLFIYGNSGLGKTHLLFAIKNHLAQEKPYIRVKYASSQIYIDDYMRELGMQKGPGEAIMGEYRNADVLIIDDIQNIIGRQASIEFFFQLVDEFIRNGKKIVIASDRAPKKLGLDERLTSRFNSGMLCLVSDPGFEMKYTILKRYYENIIMGSGDLAHMNVDTSLLSALQVHEGHLTDEQLRHMAEISGTNIRELESFCERCAGLSSEREAEGSELSGEDIDRIADEYFDTAQKIIHIDTVQSVVEEYYHVTHEELIGPRRTANIAFARHVAVYLANNLCEMTTPAIGAEFGGRDHSTVLNSLKVVENRMKEDRRICEDLQQLKNKIILKS